MVWLGFSCDTCFRGEGDFPLVSDLELGPPCTAEECHKLAQRRLIVP